MATQAFTSTGLDEAAIRAQIKGAFRMRAENTKPLWETTLFFDDMDTTRPFEEWTSFSGLGVADRKNEMEAPILDTPKQNYTKRMTVIAYAKLTGASAEAMRFLKRGSMPIREALKLGSMAMESVMTTNEMLAADVYGNAFSATLGLGMDGQPLCSSAHKLGRGGTTSNTLGAVSLSQTALELAIIQGNKFPDDAGAPAGLPQDNKRALVVPEELIFEADRILNSTLQSDTANNAKNALKGRFSETQSNRYLPSSSNWFVVNTGIKEGLIALFETRPKMMEYGDDKVGAQYFQAYEMVTFDWFDWRKVQGSSI
jgi:hypothetical protein